MSFLAAQAPIRKSAMPAEHMATAGRESSVKVKRIVEGIGLPGSVRSFGFYNGMALWKCQGISAEVEGRRFNVEKRTDRKGRAGKFGKAGKERGARRRSQAPPLLRQRKPYLTGSPP